MAKDPFARASTALSNANPEVGKIFSAFREAARKSGPLDHGTIELIQMSGFATAGHEGPFKNHATRALDRGVSVDALRQAVIVTLGSTAVLPGVARALGWIDEVVAEHAKNR